MGAADSGSWDTNDLCADGKSQKPGIPEIPGIYGDPPPDSGARARTHTHVPASLPYRAGPARRVPTPWFPPTTARGLVGKGRRGA